jgi:hypothetical protein
VPLRLVGSEMCIRDSPTGWTVCLSEGVPKGIHFDISFRTASRRLKDKG